MYRSVTRRVLAAALYRSRSRNTISAARARFCSSASAGSSAPPPPPHRNPEPAFESPPRTHHHYEEEKARVLAASLLHVSRLGWTEAAIMAGARDLAISPSIAGAFPRKEAALVEFFMDDCLQRLTDIVDSEESLRSLTPNQRIGKLVKIRLEMQAPYISKWAQALSIQAHPLNVPTSFKQRAMLIDEIWHAVDDEGTDVDWYAKRTILGGVYSATELYMLTDTSLGFHDTWAFLDGRLRDAFDLKKTAQEVKYLAEAVTAGMGNSFPGFFSRVFQR